MRSTPAGQKVRQHGDEIEVSPPEQSPSRVKNALVGLLLGTAQGGLPGGIAGAATGAIKPEMIQELLKQKHLAREEGQLERQVDLEGKRADADYRKQAAQRLEIPEPPKSDERVIRAGEYPDIPAGTVINRVWNADKKRWEDEIQNGRPVIAKSPVITGRGSVHYEPREDGLYAVREGADGRLTSEKVDGVPGKPTTVDNKQQEREAKRQAAQDEYDQLVNDERGAGEEKNRAYAYLEQLKANAPKDEFSGELTDQAKADIRQATDAAQAADKFYQSFAEKKRDAQRRVKENQVGAASTGNPPAPIGVTEASVRADAKQRGANGDEAVRKARLFGWIP
jgi:hypothetical protein